MSMRDVAEGMQDPLPAMSGFLAICTRQLQPRCQYVPIASSQDIRCGFGLSAISSIPKVTDDSIEPSSPMLP
jgi:hypothetical protein